MFVKSAVMANVKRDCKRSSSTAQWTMGTFSVDAKNAGNGVFLFAFPIIPSVELNSLQSLSNPLERVWVRGTPRRLFSYHLHAAVKHLKVLQRPQKLQLYLAVT